MSEPCWNAAAHPMGMDKWVCCAPDDETFSCPVCKTVLKAEPYYPEEDDDGR